MIGSKSCRRRKLEIIREIDFYKKRKCIFPYMSKEADRNIEMLVYELDDLEGKFSREDRYVY